MLEIKPKYDIGSEVYAIAIASKIETCKHCGSDHTPSKPKWKPSARPYRVSRITYHVSNANRGTGGMIGYCIDTSRIPGERPDVNIITGGSPDEDKIFRGFSGYPEGDLFRTLEEASAACESRNKLIDGDSGFVLYIVETSGDSHIDIKVSNNMDENNCDPNDLEFNSVGRIHVDEVDGFIDHIKTMAEELKTLYGDDPSKCLIIKSPSGFNLEINHQNAIKLRKSLRQKRDELLGPSDRRSK